MQVQNGVLLDTLQTQEKHSAIFQVGHVHHIKKLVNMQKCIENFKKIAKHHSAKVRLLIPLIVYNEPQRVHQRSACTLTVTCTVQAFAESSRVEQSYAMNIETETVIVSAVKEEAAWLALLHEGLLSKTFSSRHVQQTLGVLEQLKAKVILGQQDCKVCHCSIRVGP